MTVEFTLKTATPEDEPSASALLKAAYAVLMLKNHEDSMLAAAIPFMSQANPALLASGTYYLVQNADGQLVGAGGWTEGRPENGETEPGLAHIRHFAVHPDWAGRGIGRTLLTKCAEGARTASCTRFECYATDYAQGFYKALGFKSVRRIDVVIRPDFVFPSVLMKAAIDPPEQTPTLNQTPKK